MDIVTDNNEIKNDPKKEEKSKKLPEKDSEKVVKEKESALKTIPEEKSSAFPKVLGVLSLGVAGLAIFFSLAAMKKVDNNIGKINSSIKEISTKTSSLKNEMNEKFGYVDFELNGIQSQMKKSQRMTAIMELKRALVTVQEVSNVENSPELQVKSQQLVSNIESFLKDLNIVKKNTPPGKIEVMEEPGEVPDKI
jgi:hypothetical protein